MAKGPGGTLSRSIALAVAIVTVVITLLGTAAGQSGQVGTRAPELAGGPWIGGDPLTMAGLQGRVVLLEFWTYG